MTEPRCDFCHEPVYPLCDCPCGRSTRALPDYFKNAALTPTGWTFEPHHTERTMTPAEVRAFAERCVIGGTMKYTVTCADRDGLVLWDASGLDEAQAKVEMENAKALVGDSTLPKMTFVMAHGGRIVSIVEVGK